MTISSKTEPSSDRQRRLQNQTVLGVLLMIVGLALYPISDAFIKHLMGTYSVHQTTFLRAVTRLVPLLIAASFQGGIISVLSTKHPGKHAFRLLVNLSYTYSFMYAVSLGSLTVVYTLGYTAPFFMIFLSAFLLKEKITKEKWFAVFIGMIGVFIAMKPGTNLFTWASIIVLFGTFLGALNKIFMRKLATTEHSLAIASYPNIVMIVVTLPFLLNSWQPMPWSDWISFAIVGSITAVAQYAIAQALRCAEASTLAPIDYSTFFWVVSLDFLWFNKTPDLSTILGASIIVASNLFILLKSRRDSAKKVAQTAS